MEVKVVKRACGGRTSVMVQASSNAALNQIMAIGDEPEVASLPLGDFDGIMSYFYTLLLVLTRVLFQSK